MLGTERGGQFSGLRRNVVVVVTKELVGYQFNSRSIRQERDELLIDCGFTVISRRNYGNFPSCAKPFLRHFLTVESAAICPVEKRQHPVSLFHLPLHPFGPTFLWTLWR